MTNPSRPRTSAADIVIRRPAGSQRPGDAVARMSRLMDDCGTNRHDRVIAGITACISDGIDTTGRIVAVLSAAGAKTPHVYIMLARNVGPNPARHRWQKDANERYILHPAVPDTEAA